MKIYSHSLYCTIYTLSCRLYTTLHNDQWKSGWKRKQFSQSNCNVFNTFSTIYCFCFCNYLAFGTCCRRNKWLGVWFHCGKYLKFTFQDLVILQQSNCALVDHIWALTSTPKHDSRIRLVLMFTFNTNFHNIFHFLYFNFIKNMDAIIFAAFLTRCW